MLVYITNNRKKLYINIWDCSNSFINEIVSTVEFSSLYIYLTFNQRLETFVKIASEIVFY